MACAHIALNNHGLYQSTTETLNDIGADIQKRYTIRYNRGRWSCVVVKGGIGFNLVCDKLVSFKIDGYTVVLMEESDF